MNIDEKARQEEGVEQETSRIDSSRAKEIIDELKKDIMVSTKRRFLIYNAINDAHSIICCPGCGERAFSYYDVKQTIDGIKSGVFRRSVSGEYHFTCDNCKKIVALVVVPNVSNDFDKLVIFFGGRNWTIR